MQYYLIAYALTFSMYLRRRKVLNLLFCFKYYAVRYEILYIG